MRIKGLITHEEARSIIGAPATVSGSKPKRQKYNAQKVTNENGSFDSKYEASWAGILVMLQSRGIIKNLKLDKRELKFSFDVAGVRVGEYTADARFDAVERYELGTSKGLTVLQPGQHYVCDAKSKATRKIRDYPLRRNLMFALHRVDLLEL